MPEAVQLLLDQKITIKNPVLLAESALMKEVLLSPKPGLVDSNNTGSHYDMDMTTFIASISAISPRLGDFYSYGWNNALLPAAVFLHGLREIGKRCEQAMFAATHNINTHKGAIFAFGLILSVIGKMLKNKKFCSYKTISQEIKMVCQGLVDRELIHNKAKTTGEKLYHQFQLTGARGEAESGYHLVVNIALPIYLGCLKQGYDENQSLLHAMLHLLAENKDTNIVSRSGMEGLIFVQQYAENLLYTGGALTDDYQEKLIRFDNTLIKYNLSPGGTADLIAVTWFLSHYPVD